MDALSKMMFRIKAVHEYKDGASIRQISDKYNVPYTTTREILVKHKVKLRGVGKYAGPNTRNVNR